MPLERIHLRKLLKLLFLDANRQRSAVRAEIRQDRAREAGQESSGGDFYAPFWADAKKHVLGYSDLHTAVDQRVTANNRRRFLYPQLRDGFLLWWNERRRWTNEPIVASEPFKARFPLTGTANIVKVDSILSVRDGSGVQRLIYPYFSPAPILSEDAARLGLWLLKAALPRAPAESLRVLDVIRGQTFSLDRTPLIGNEEGDLRQRYSELLRLRDELERE